MRSGGSTDREDGGKDSMTRRAEDTRDESYRVATLLI